MTRHAILAFEFLEDPIADPNNHPHIGSTLILKCISTSNYDRCTWKHQKDTCHFDWTRHHNTVKNPRCDGYGDRLLFIGNYQTQECKIKLTKIKLSDSGNWTCEMRRNSDGKSIEGDIDIQVINPLHNQNLIQKALDMLKLSLGREKK